MMMLRHGFLAWIILSSLAGLIGCGPSEDHSPNIPPYLETGDLPQLQERKLIRILIPPHGQVEYLPREGSPFSLERTLIESFAKSIDLTPIWIRLESHDQLIPSILKGEGDLIAANLTMTPERKRQIAFSVPVAIVREQLITRVDDKELRGPADLSGRKIVVRRSSSFWQTALDLQAQNPQIEMQAAPEYLDTEQILHKVAQGKFDVTVADSNLLDAALDYRSDLRVAFDLTGDRPVAWGIRPDAKALLKAVNRFLNEAKLARPGSKVYRADLPDIKQRRVLRVLTRNNPATYFLWRGELLGFEYELIRQFAKQHQLRVEMVVPPSREDLIPWLLEGRGDVVAASMTITKEREAQGIAFSRPYAKVSEILVSRADETETTLPNPASLANRTVAVRRSSSYWGTLEQLRQSGVDFTLQAVPEDVETEEIIAGVAEGKYDLTVADSHILNIELTWRKDIRAAFPLGEPTPHGWGVRKDDTQLLAALNAFLKKEYRGVFYNITFRKYFKDSRKIRKHIEFRATRTGVLSPYDDIVKRYADRFGFDWRLIVAQMFQESRFDPNARSWAGAVGLMQVMPRTAKELDVGDVRKPESGIHAGVKYLDWVRKRFEPELSVQDRTWFTLAAYNVGYGHVLDARRLAKKLGYNPNRWFGHVEKAIQLLSLKKYARQARHGYCRGSEPITYVRKIKAHYDAYLQMQTANSRVPTLDRSTTFPLPLTAIKIPTASYG
ncbi:MAG: transporter substrate-binding domain-containing protein [Nitrospinae bacterium]|nr:transporter substrate-binding domain-containing protein [Nitrospinota bacterium]